MKNQTAIKKLKDDKNYYGEYGRQFLSNSDIASLLWNPQEFRKSSLEGKAIVEGRYFHTLMLEPDKLKEFPICSANMRRGKVWDECIEKFGTTDIILQKEADDIQKAADKMRSNLYFFEQIYQEENIFEQPGILELYGEKWKGKADVLTKDFVIDLKTTSSIKDFKKNSYWYCYDSQSYLYSQIFGKPMKFLVIDKKTHQLGVFEPGDHMYESGKQKVIKAVEEYRRFYGSNPTEDIESYFIHEII